MFTFSANLYRTRMKLGVIDRIINIRDSEHYAEDKSVVSRYQDST